MKKCPFCAEEIQDAAVVCKHCGRDLKGGASQVQLVQPKKKAGVAAWGCVGLLLLIVVGWCSSLTNPSSNRTPARKVSGAAAPQRPPTDQLALLDSRGYESEGGGYYIIEGRVKNISKESLKNVEAKGTWFDKSNGFVTSDDTLIDYNPILPGQTSPFKIMSRKNPAMSSYTVEFKSMSGGAIPTDDQRSTKK